MSHLCVEEIGIREQLAATLRGGTESSVLRQRLVVFKRCQRTERFQQPEL